MYSTRQDGKSWGSIVVETIMNWDLKQPNIYQRILYKTVQNKFGLIVIVVDEMKLTTDSPMLLNYLNSKLSANLGMKFFGRLI